MREGLLLRLQSEGWKIRRRSLASTWGQRLEESGGAIGALFCGMVGRSNSFGPGFGFIKEMGGASLESERGSKLFEFGQWVLSGKI